MSTENTPVDLDMDDLDAFSVDFFGQKQDDSEPASSESEEDVADQESDALEPKDDTQTPEDDDALETEEDDEVEDEVKEEAPKPKKNRFQERIDEVVGKQRETERQLQQALAELNNLKKTSENKPNESATPVETPTNTSGPKPDDLNPDGTAKYPLGDFDPNFITDLTKYAIREEREAIARQEQEKERVTAMEAEKQALQNSWQEKLGPAQERYPDFQEKGQQLVDTFEGIDEAYGEYLSATIMSMDYGPDVLYYLANNPDEASKIVKAGATKATIALGRLEAKFALADEEKQQARPKVSKAPTPPAHRNKGSAVSVAEVPDDTDDLDAFAKKLFKK